ncbi:MAG: hypothetical protein H6Q89_5293 [Myxococcaceae bacterium]|nr:hypothetical protein [Myxococcaceae bacterium]
MSSALVAILCAVVILGSTDARAATVITTKDGKKHSGMILQQLDRGYLFKLNDGSTVVIDYATVDAVETAPARAVEPAREAAPAPVEAPAPPRPADEPRRPLLIEGAQAEPKRPLKQAGEARVLEEEARGVTLSQRVLLKQERGTLNEEMPGLGTSITSEIFGGLFVIAGFAMIPYAIPVPVWLQQSSPVDEGREGRQTLIAISAGVMIVAGITFLAIGTIALIKRIITRAKISRRLSEVDEELEALGEKPQSVFESLAPAGVSPNGSPLTLARF